MNNPTSHLPEVAPGDRPGDVPGPAQDADTGLLYAAYGQMRANLLVTAIEFPILTALVWNIFTHEKLLAWMGVVFATLAMRYVLWAAFKRAAPGPDALTLWRNLLLAGTVATGAAWSFGPSVMLPQASGVEVGVIVAILISVCWIAVLTYASQQVAMRAFVAATLLPAAVVAWASTGSEKWLIGLLLVFVFVVLLVHGRRLGQSMRALIEAQADQRAAADEAGIARARYFDLYEMAPIGYCTVNGHGLILEANFTAATLLGVARGALVNQPVTRFIHKEDQHIYQQRRTRLAETGEPQACELRLARHDGTTFWAHLAATAARDAAGAPALRIVLSDATGHKHAEAARAAAIIDASMDAIIGVDEFECVVVFSAAAEKMFQLSAGEAMGQTIDRFIPARFRGGHRAHFREFMKNAHTRRMGGQFMPVSALRADGTEFPIEASISHIAIEDKHLFTVTLRDITQRKQAEDALMTAQRNTAVLAQLGRELAEAATSKVAAIHILDAAQQLLGWESSWLHLWDEQRQKLVDVADFDLIDGEIREVPSNVVAQGAPSLTARRVMEEGPQLILRDSDEEAGAAGVLYGNGLRSLSLMFVPIKLAGKIIGILSIQSYQRNAYDAADLDLLHALATHCAGALVRLQNADALRESEERFQLANRAVFDVIWDQDLLSKAIWWGDHFEEVYGHSPAEAGKNGDYWRDCVHPEDRERVDAGVEEVLDAGGDTWSANYRFRRKDGAYAFVEDRAIIIKNAAGEPVRMLGAMRDVTERRQMERELQAQRDFATQIINTVGQGLTVTDSDGRFEFVNPAFAHLCGYEPADLIGHLPSEVTAPEAHVDLENQRLARRAGQRTTYESRMHRSDGGAVDVLITGVPRAHEGQFAGTIAVITDLTERKQAEAARMMLEAQLRESQKMEAIGLLAGGIAHDFNNILATILGNVELAREDVSTNPLALQSLNEIRKAGSRARDLVQQILSFSRRQPSERKVIALAPVVEESARLLRATLPARLNLDVHCEADLPAVLADATQMQQIIINLCTNAMHAIRERPGRIGIRLDAVMLDPAMTSTHPALRALQEKQRGRTLRLAVTDDGCGMDAATLARIFEPFFTTRQVDEGTGLGLSVVHGIVQTHEGAIVVDSQPGKGSIFTVYLPAAEAAASARQPGQSVAESAPVRAPGGQHILYVDDDESLVFLVQRLLERRGFRVSGHTDQREALAAIRADPAAFDLVVTDYNMPGMSGLDVARAVRAIRADLPVAIASGFIDETLQSEAAGAGVRELIFKANAVEDLSEAFARLAQAVGEKA
ncbi:MAG: PAS domain S-box protein [Betaproteobacteria bacterium]|nr:PAS domain S-box protein [Betaproteobacteria bacterium]